MSTTPLTSAQLPGTAGFDIRQIRQSNPLPGGINLITLALSTTPTTQLSAANSAVLTVSNLRNLEQEQLYDSTPIAGGIVLPLHAVTGGNDGHLLFCVREASADLSLSLGAALVYTSTSLYLRLCESTQMDPDLTYLFSFKIVNLEVEEEETPTVYVAAEGSVASSRIAVTELESSTDSAKGLPGGLCVCVCVVCCVCVCVCVCVCCVFVCV